MRIIELCNDILEFYIDNDDNTIYHYFEIKYPYFRRYGTHLTLAALGTLRENCKRILRATEFAEDES